MGDRFTAYSFSVYPALYVSESFSSATGQYKNIMMAYAYHEILRGLNNKK